jgi:uncharacterized protein YmfQ (DUF2313 family)
MSNGNDTPLSEQLFGVPRFSEIVRVLTSNLPNGRAWDMKNVEGSNIHNLCRMLAPSLRYIYQRLNELVIELDIEQTTKLISEWETSVNIPDQCFDIGATLEDRRALVKTKFSRKPVLTKEDYIALASDFGVIVNIYNSKEYNELFNFDYDFDYDFYDTLLQKNMLAIEYVSGDNFELVKCLYNRITPANIVLFYF